LVTNPSIILLDEPFSGVDPLAVSDVQDIVRSLKAKGLGVLITDHNVRETLAVVDRAYLLCEGQVLREGDSDFLVNDEVSRELYLGPQFSM
jgi:lipopolysaccharide export system ATP-binding protein